jgi:tetratricopeptide (TPR) repeat protein
LNRKRLFLFSCASLLWLEGCSIAKNPATTEKEPTTAQTVGDVVGDKNVMINKVEGDSTVNLTAARPEDVAEIIARANTIQEQAFDYARIGDPVNAEILLKDSVEILKKGLGPDNPNVARHLIALASFYERYDQDQGRVEPLVKQALAINEKTLGPDHADVAGNLEYLAKYYHDKGRLTEAESLYRRALTIKEKAFGEDDRDVSKSLDTLALFYYEQGKCNEAEPLYRRILAIDEKKDYRQDVVFDLNRLALLNKCQGKYIEAKQLYQRSLTIAKKVSSDTDIVTIQNDLRKLESVAQGRVRVVVKSIVPNSQAEKLGIQVSDIITQYKNKAILDADVFLYERSLEPNTSPSQELKVLRDGKELVFIVKPGKIGIELQDQFPQDHK